DRHHEKKVAPDRRNTVQEKRDRIGTDKRCQRDERAQPERVEHQTPIETVGEEIDIILKRIAVCQDTAALALQERYLRQMRNRRDKGDEIDQGHRQKKRNGDETVTPASRRLCRDDAG